MRKKAEKRMVPLRVVLEVPANYVDYDELRECDTTSLLETLRCLSDAFGRIESRIIRADHPVEVTCPHCGKKARVRRVWRADVTANTGVDGTSPISVYPIEDADTYVDESNFDQRNSFYCGACGADIAKTENDLIDLLKKEHNA